MQLSKPKIPARRPAGGQNSKSKILFERAKRVLVGGVNSPVRAFTAVGGHPLFIRRGRGPWIWDADGRRHLDFCLSWGPLILGHARPEVVRAASAALRKGSTFGAPCEEEILLAETIRRALPSIERIRFTSSGTEAVMGALRLSRAFTGRPKVVKFAGCYHGHWDGLLVQAGSGATTLGRPDSAGVPPRWTEDTIVLPYNDPESLRRTFARCGRSIACVIVEPVAGNMGVVAPRPDFLEALRTLPKQEGSLLIFDEVITGFRVAYGGAQALFGLRPDLTVLGKIIGGGLPVGAFGGRKEVMALLSPVGPVYQAGTLSGNPVAMAAGLATLRLLKGLDPYRALARRTRRLADALSQTARGLGVDAQINTAPGMFTVFFSKSPVTDYAGARRSDTKRYARFFRALLGQGIYFPPAQFEAALLSACHTERLLERFLKAAARAFKNC